MRTRTTVMSILLLSAVCAAPASANYFSNPATGTMLNIGSAPNPTSQDLRAIGDSSYGPELSSNYGQVQAGSQLSMAQLTALDGQPVFGAHGAYLGYILTVDHKTRQAELQTPRGVAVALPAALLAERNGRVIAPTTSRADVTAMAKIQTGHTMALNQDRRHEPFQG